MRWLLALILIAAPASAAQLLFAGGQWVALHRDGACEAEISAKTKASIRFLPLEANGKSVDLDLVNNIMRRPYRERLRLIVILQRQQHAEFPQRVLGAVVRQQAFAELHMLLGIQRICVVQRLQHSGRIAAPSCLVEPARLLRDVSAHL